MIGIDQSSAIVREAVIMIIILMPNNFFSFLGHFHVVVSCYFLFVGILFDLEFF